MGCVYTCIRSVFRVEIEAGGAWDVVCAVMYMYVCICDVVLCCVVFCYFKLI